MADLGDLAKFMDSLVANSAQAQLANLYAMAVADAIVIDLAYSTPADVGEAISNWQVTLDGEATTILPAYFPSPKGRTRKGVWAHTVDPVQTAQFNAPATIDAARAVLRTKAPGQIIFITNNLDYIRLLDQGSSDQAPAGFVERARIIGEQVTQQKVLVMFP